MDLTENNGHREQIYRLFLSADADGNGTLDRGEAKELFKKCVQNIDDTVFDKIWSKELDKDGNGSIDFTEFYQFLSDSQGHDVMICNTQEGTESIDFSHKLKSKIQDVISSSRKALRKTERGLDYFPTKENLEMNIQENNRFIKYSKSSYLHRCRMSLFEDLNEVIESLYESVIFWQQDEDTLTKNYYKTFGNAGYEENTMELLKRTRDLFCINEVFESETDRLELSAFSKLIYDKEEGFNEIVYSLLGELIKTFEYPNKIDLKNGITKFQLEICAYYFMGANISVVSEETMMQLIDELYREIPNFFKNLIISIFESSTPFDRNQIEVHECKLWALKLLITLMEKNEGVKKKVLIEFKELGFFCVAKKINEYLNLCDVIEQLNTESENIIYHISSFLQMATYFLASIFESSSSSIEKDIINILDNIALNVSEDFSPLYSFTSFYSHTEGFTTTWLRAIQKWIEKFPYYFYLPVANIIRFFANVKQLDNVGKYSMCTEEIAKDVLEFYTGTTFRNDDKDYNHMCLFILQGVFSLMNIYAKKDINVQEELLNSNEASWSSFLDTMKYVLKLESSSFHSTKENLVLEVLRLIETLSSSIYIHEEFTQLIVNHVHSDSVDAQGKSIEVLTTTYNNNISYEHSTTLYTYLKYVPRLAIEVPIFKRRDLEMYVSFQYCTSRYNIDNIMLLLTLFETILNDKLIKESPRDSNEAGQAQEEISKVFSFIVLNEIDLLLVGARDEVDKFDAQAHNMGLLSQDSQSMLNTLKGLLQKIEKITEDYTNDGNFLLFKDMWTETKKTNGALTQKLDNILTRWEIPFNPPEITEEQLYEIKAKINPNFSATSSSLEETLLGKAYKWDLYKQIMYIEDLELVPVNEEYNVVKYVYLQASKMYLGEQWDANHKYRNPLISFLNPNLEGNEHYAKNIYVSINGERYFYNDETYPWVINESEGCVVFKGTSSNGRKNLLPGRDAKIKVSFWRTRSNCFFDDSYSRNDRLEDVRKNDLQTVHQNTILVVDDKVYGDEEMEGYRYDEEDCAKFSVAIYDSNELSLSDTFQEKLLRVETLLIKRVGNGDMQDLYIENTSESTLSNIRNILRQYYHLSEEKFKLFLRWSKNESFKALQDEGDLIRRLDEYYVTDNEGDNPEIQIRLTQNVSTGRRFDWERISFDMKRALSVREFTETFETIVINERLKRIHNFLYFTSEITRDILKSLITENFTTTPRFKANGTPNENYKYDKAVKIKDRTINILFNINCDQSREINIITDLFKLTCCLVSFLCLHSGVDLNNPKVQFFLEFTKPNEQGLYSRHQLERILLDVNENGSHALKKMKVWGNKEYFTKDEFYVFLTDTSEDNLNSEFLNEQWYLLPKKKKIKSDGGNPSSPKGTGKKRKSDDGNPSSPRRAKQTIDTPSYTKNPGQSNTNTRRP